MKAIKEFIIDFWRELLVLAIFVFGGLLVFSYMNQRDEIATLKQQIADLKDDSPEVATTETSQEEVVTPVEAAPEEEEIEEKTYEGFDTELPAGWALMNTQGEAGSKLYTFTNEDKIIDLQVNPSDDVVASDIVWSHQYDPLADSSEYKLNLTSSSETLCSQGEDNCTVGDGRLQIRVVGDATPDGRLTPLNLFYTDDSFDPDGDSFTSLKAFIDTIRITAP